MEDIKDKLRNLYKIIENNPTAYNSIVEFQFLCVLYVGKLIRQNKL